MENFDIDIGSRELYSLKNFNFDIINSGSADLQVDSIVTSSINIELPYINTPFIVMKNTRYTIFGYIKIINRSLSNRLDYIDFNVSQINEDTTTMYDIYRYYINYEGIVYPTFLNISTISNITYIKNMLILYIDSDNIIDDSINVILKSIDGFDYYIFPKKYKITDTKYCFIYTHNSITNKIVDIGIKLLTMYQSDAIELYRFCYRTM